MEDLMLHVLDIAMNAVTAGARTVKIAIVEDTRTGRLLLQVADNGPGMSAELVRRVLEEYATTKVKAAGWVAFGLALLRGTCELVDGTFRVLSRPGRGTLVSAELPADHPDRPPLGNVAESLQALLVGCGDVEVCFAHRVDGAGYRIDTRTVRRVVGEAYSTPTVRRWLIEQVREGEAALAARRVES